MNEQNIRKIIEIIFDEEKAFSMADYGNPVCGTAACICGWANHLADPNKTDDFDDHVDAAKFLGIEEDDYDTISNLFFAEDGGGNVPMNRVTRQEAIITLENFIKTGNVDWSHCHAYEKF